MTSCTHTDPQSCSLPTTPVRQLPDDLDSNRLSLIRYIDKKWVNGTVLKYHFLTNNPAWLGAEDQKQAVRDAFQEWKDLGIGLIFEESTDPTDAQIRIGFEPGGSWSYVGRDILQYAPDPAERTTNFGWDLTTPYGKDTALHELAHIFGFPHEHQNPNAGIVWDEPETYRVFGGPPNNWTRDQVYRNIIRKIPAQDVAGSNWDKDSVMHYNLPAGVISIPTMYQTQPLTPAGGLSPVDKVEMVKFYPPLTPITTVPTLEHYKSVKIDIDPGEQLDFHIKVPWGGRHTIQTFGHADTVMVLFEEMNGNQVFIAADDDSGLSRNAKIRVRLIPGRTYHLKVRLYYASAKGRAALMLW